MPEDRYVVGIELVMRGTLVADVERSDELCQVEQGQMGEKARTVFFVVVDDRSRTRVRVWMSEEVFQVFYSAVSPVVGDHSVRHVQILGLGFVPQIHRRDEVMATVVRMDVVVAGVPPVRGHVDPTAQLDLDRRPLPGLYLDSRKDGFVLEAAPHFELGLTHR